MSNMPKEYLELAAERVAAKWDGYSQPECYGYDFRGWVSPYTKGANKLGGIAVVLQDWMSADGLKNGLKENEGNPDYQTQKYGRDPNLRTNKRLECFLQEFFNLGIKEVYGTNVFPFIKPGDASSSIPKKDIAKAAQYFLKREIEIAKPKYILAFGDLASHGLESAGIPCVHLPHPAARKSDDYHKKEWKRAQKIWEQKFR